MAWQITISVLLLTGIFFLSFNLEMGGMGLVSNLNALMIVMGGTICASLMTYPMKKLVWAFQILKKSLGPQEKSDGLIQAVVRLSRHYRGGWDIRHLEQQVKDLPPGLLKTGVGLIAYQYDRDKSQQVLHQEALCIRGQYESAGNILHNIAQIVPSMGLIGTIVNFIRFAGLANDIHGLAGCTAVAFLSTFYGVLLARLGLIPLANKLKEFIAEAIIPDGFNSRRNPGYLGSRASPGDPVQTGEPSGSQGNSESKSQVAHGSIAALRGDGPGRQESGFGSGELNKENAAVRGCCIARQHYFLGPAISLSQFTELFGMGGGDLFG